MKQVLQETMEDAGVVPKNADSKVLEERGFAEVKEKVKVKEGLGAGDGEKRKEEGEEEEK